MEKVPFASAVRGDFRVIAAIPLKWSMTQSVSRRTLGLTS